MRRILSSLLLLCASCVDSDDLGELPVAPLPLDDALAYFDPDHSSVVIVDPAGKAGPGADRSLLRIDAGSAPVVARSAPRPDDPSRAQLLIVDPGDTQLLVVSDKSGATATLPIGIPLEAIDVSADGAFAIAYQPDGVAPRRSIFAFPNTVAVVDLREGPRATPLRLGGSGARPLCAAFAGSMRLSDGGAETVNVPLSLVFVKGGIVPVDLQRAVAGPMVPLTPDADRDVLPKEVLFTDNLGDKVRGAIDGVERAFVRSSDGQLYVLALSMAPADAAMQVLVALENVVTPETPVFDAELYFDNDGNELLLAAVGDELILVNGYTGVATRFDAGTYVDSLVRFTDPDSGAPLALGYSREQPSSTIVRLDPLGLEGRRGNAIETMHLSSEVAEIETAVGSKRAVLAYENGSEIGVLDLTRTGEVLDLVAGQDLSARRLSPSGDALWLVSVSPEDLEPHLAVVDLEELQSQRHVRLDRGGSVVGSAGGYLYVDHADAGGAVTFFPADDLRREAGIAFRGLLYTDLLTLDPESQTDEGGEE